MVEETCRTGLVHGKPDGDIAHITSRDMGDGSSRADTTENFCKLRLDSCIVQIESEVDMIMMKWITYLCKQSIQIGNYQFLGALIT